jgi:hypothetical protein
MELFLKKRRHPAGPMIMDNNIDTKATNDSLTAGFDF